MIGTLGSNIGKGLLAGIAGTAAMTVSSTLEAKLRGRDPSTAPADAAKKVLGIRAFESEGAKSRFSTLVHWGYGTGWGAAYGLLRTTGLSDAAATPAHGAAVWGAAAAMLPSVGVALPFWKWGRKEVGIDLWHHAVYATATGLAYAALDNRG
ncbi:MAG: hypothetical protein ABIR67_12505 [Gaiellaceae bacterium]